MGRSEGQVKESKWVGFANHNRRGVSTTRKLLRGINRVAVKQLDLDSALKLKGTYNRKLH